MQIVKLEDYTQRLGQALGAEDLDLIRDVSGECDQYLRQHLPLKGNSDEDLTRLVDEMEKLLASYRSAIQFVENAKAAAGLQLQTLGRNRNNTHKYLDIARNLGV
ncbi:MAG: hypothetical protein VYA55_11460 [Pseudomonadota bacterium]|nr:hypothetical protein [Pseudomonadota bacterium]